MRGPAKNIALAGVKALTLHDTRVATTFDQASQFFVSDSDLRFIDENFKQIERMLTQLSDYSRLFEGESTISAISFSGVLLMVPMPVMPSSVSTSTTMVL